MLVLLLFPLHLRIAKSRVIQIMADTGREHDCQILLLPEDPVEAAAVDHDIHHLSDAEAVAKVVERILTVH